MTFVVIAMICLNIVMFWLGYTLGFSYGLDEGFDRAWDDD